ncbi:uncharacterized protein LOC123222608 isoform X2 [Mangifera indica]|uniref:uncharacterized protein LOC123222608 isoform X2 n=1 Tax=Mangifera indica TaxID=29780 RepID=UPI001CFB6E46|nr:uncharacterized protein LOC123222608 isoform X2 [Mangifera indica]XP_044501397.1 uncharacterized protein LOC123222608 isoform X2 [Mangifera indica]XP_044501398.1 uncharacterized protein LOC123222608 isoform X2 [Mangifera indica]
MIQLQHAESDLLVYKIGGGPQAPRSALPVGADPVANPLRLVPVNIDQDLLHSVLAISYAKEPDQLPSSGDMMILLMGEETLTETVARLYIGLSVLAIESIHKHNYMRRSVFSCGNTRWLYN